MQEVFVIKDKENFLITINNEIVIAAVKEVPEVITIGIEGPAGPAGPAGSSIVKYTAGENLGGHKLVVIDNSEKAYYADTMNTSHLNKVVGITINAAMRNTAADIQTYGILSEPSWNWDILKPVFAGFNGTLTQLVPSVGFIQQVATVISPTKIFINIRAPIVV